MDGMIQVRRTNYEARTKKHKSGRIEEIPAYYTCRYCYGGKEIARYNSQEDILRLRTEYINNDFSMSYYDRAMQCELSDAYMYLFYMLNVDETTSMSEYMIGI